VLFHPKSESIRVRPDGKFNDSYDDNTWRAGSVDPSGSIPAALAGVLSVFHGGGY
jgi:hypothetical protein